MSDTNAIVVGDDIENPIMTVVPIFADNGTYSHEILTFWCPGCNGPHQIRHGEGGWNWNKHLNRPTVTPSLHDTRRVHGKTETHCHSFVTEGSWVYLSDSRHELAGQTVPLPPLPDWLVSQARAAAPALP